MFCLAAWYFFKWNYLPKFLNWKIIYIYINQTNCNPEPIFSYTSIHWTWIDTIGLWVTMSPGLLFPTWPPSLIHNTFPVPGGIGLCGPCFSKGKIPYSPALRFPKKKEHLPTYAPSWGGPQWDSVNVLSHLLAPPLRVRVTNLTGETPEGLPSGGRLRLPQKQGKGLHPLPFNDAQIFQIPFCFPAVSILGSGPPVLSGPRLWRPRYAKADRDHPQSYLGENIPKLLCPTVLPADIASTPDVGEDNRRHRSKLCFPVCFYHTLPRLWDFIWL